MWVGGPMDELDQPKALFGTILSTVFRDCVRLATSDCNGLMFCFYTDRSLHDSP